jgi:prepilin-type N-terminal cleavage/methylation domain-containing protein
MFQRHDSTPRPPIAGELRLAGPAPRSSPLAPRCGFTLFELILAIALSAMLLALIGAAINLYLVRVDASRARLEEAQLARSVLAMIADDLRASFVYQPQDTSEVEDLASSAASFDVDTLDQPSSSASSSSSRSSSSSSSSGTTSSFSAFGSSGGSVSLGTGGDPAGVLPLGVNGTLDELIVDVSRLPPLEEPIALAHQGAAPAGSAVAAATQVPRISDVRTVRYFVRQGTQIDPSSPAATSLAPEGQASAGGLVRQEIDRAARTWAEQAGNQSLLQTAGLALVAPEVVHVEFHYFDGTQILDSWDMKQMGHMPLAVEARIWITSTATAAAQSALQYGLGDLSGTNQYWQTVYLPLSGLSPPGTASSSASATSADTQSTSSSSTSGVSDIGGTGGSGTPGGSSR